MKTAGFGNPAERTCTFQTLSKTLILVCVILFAMSAVVPARGHSGEPRLEISLERINPGGVIEVRGVEFDYDEQVSLSLMRSEIRISLIEVTADWEGVFTQIIALPNDLPPGEYIFRAESDHHLVISPTLTVWGGAAQAQEDTAVREQSDVQLGAIPTLITTDPGVSSTPFPQATVLETRPPKPDSTLLIYSILFSMGLITLLGIRILKKR